MLKVNKLFAVLMSILMLMQGAMGVALKADATETPEITVSSAEAKAGDTVTLTVSLNNNTGFAGFSLMVDYDADVLTLTAFTQGDVLNAVDPLGLESQTSVGIANWATTTNTSGDGTLLYLTFSVNKGVSSGDYLVNLVANDFFSVNDSGMFLDYPCVINPGTVTVGSGEHDHKYTTVTTPPTCTDQGYTTHTCQCGDSYIDSYVAALGHTPGDAVRENERDDGSYDLVVYCSTCKTELSREYVVLPGVTISGTVTSYGTATDDVTVTLIDANGETVYSTIVTGNSAEYSFSSVSAGSYTLQISKINHVTRSYTVVVEDSNVTQDAKICLRGDVTGDGKVTATDYSRLLAHVKKTSVITDTYMLLCADVTGEGKITATDYSRLLAHVKKVSLLW